MSTVEALSWLYEQGSEELKKGNYEESRQHFRRIIQMTRDSEWVEKANAKLAQVYLEEDNLFWAMDHVHRALKRDDRNPEYHYIKGKIHLRRKQWHDAASEAVNAVEEGLENARYYRLLGRAVYEYEGYTEAKRYLDWALECEPHDPDVRLDYARIEIREENFQQALHLLRQTLDHNEDDERIRESIRAIQENWKITGS